MSVTFGYGAVIPVQTFINVFPGSFRYENGWVATGEQPLDTNLVKFIYPEYETAETIFITTVGATDFGFEKGRVWIEYTGVDLERIIEQAHQLKPWLEQQFPNNPVGFYMYATNDE